MKNAQVHRFQNFAALSLPGNGETVYLLPRDARIIANALRECAADIYARQFTDSRFRTRDIPLDNDGSRFYDTSKRPRARRVRHEVCKAGAAVRLHGYAPARVLRVYRAEDFGGIVSISAPRILADCVITARGADWKAGNIGPHGYRTGERVTVYAGEAVPRDCIRKSRQSLGRLFWSAFAIESDAGGEARGIMPKDGAP